MLNGVAEVLIRQPSCPMEVLDVEVSIGQRDRPMEDLDENRGGVDSAPQHLRRHSSSNYGRLGPPRTYILTQTTVGLVPPGFSLKLRSA